VAAVGLVWVPLWLAVTSGRAMRATLDARGAVHGSHATTTTVDPGPKDPYEARWLLAHPAVWRAVVAVLFTAPLMAFCFLWASKVLVTRAHVAPLGVGRYLWVPPLVFDVASIAFGALSSRRHRRGRVEGSPKALFAAAAVLAVAGGVAIGRPAEPWAIVAAVSVAMAGGGAMFALLTEDMLARVSPSKVSTASGITAAAQSVAYVIANPLIGLARERTTDASVTMALGALVIPGALVWLGTTAPRRQN
jgi:predicted MFS family arabinose efflux permease